MGYSWVVLAPTQFLQAYLGWRVSIPNWFPSFAKPRSTLRSLVELRQDSGESNSWISWPSAVWAGPMFQQPALKQLGIATQCQDLGWFGSICKCGFFRIYPWNDHFFIFHIGKLMVHRLTNGCRGTLSTSPSGVVESLVNTWRGIPTPDLESNIHILAPFQMLISWTCLVYPLVN